MSNTIEKTKIDQLVSRFYSTFNNSKGMIPNLNILNNLFIPEGLIINGTAGNTEILNLNQFIETRSTIFSSGNLKEFQEEEISEITTINSEMATRTSKYQKSGIKENIHFKTLGIKNFQFMKHNGVWLISSVIWVDK